MALHRYTAVALTAAACLGASAQTRPGDVIFSDTFDAAPVGTNQTQLPGGWTVTGGTVDVLGPPGPDPRPGHGHYVDLQGSSNAPGSLSISLFAPVSGTYLVEFDISGNARGEHGAIETDVLAEGLGLRANGIIFNVPSDFPFLRTGVGTGIVNEGPFVVTFSTPPIVHGDVTQVTDTGLLLDNVTVTFTQAIPEPTSAMLMLVGLAAVAGAGLAGRRRGPGPRLSGTRGSVPQRSALQPPRG